jgi:class 3 adenylate cyclase/tetratricopeptide (TPR) repeat protein
MTDAKGNPKADRPDELRAARAAARDHTNAVLRLPNVIGCGVARRIVRGRETTEWCLVAFVSQKLPPAMLAADAMVPRELTTPEGTIRTDVVEREIPRPSHKRPRHDQESCMDLGAWLRGLGLGQYEQAFHEVLARLTAQDLKELGVTPVGHRRRLLDAIAALRASAASSPDDARQMRILSALPVDPEGDRRQVTVLFADLTGSTKWGQQMDAEEVHALLEQFFDRADSAIQQHGGKIVRHIGDCVMAVFGAPVAHDNDAERAARAALEIQAAIPEVSARVGRPLGVHIGIAGGQVVASRTGSATYSEYTVTGNAANLASRLTDAAAAGEIFVSEETYGALAERFDCTEAGALPMKGFAEPVRAWRLRDVRPTARLRRPFVGRRAELRRLVAVLSACRETERGQTVYIRGEAGIGKTRLIEEIQRAGTDAGFSCHAALVLDFGAGAGRDAIRALARSLLGVEVTTDVAATREAAAAALSAGVVGRDDAVFLNDLLDVPQPPELRPIYEAMDVATRSGGRERVVAGILDRKSRERPRLLIVEDLHWADEAVLMHLAKLTIAVTQHPALLIMTSRIEGDPLDEEWRANTASAPLTMIDLGPLPADDARALAEALIAANTAFAERCVERAAGNPLFLDQLLRHADESHALAVPGSVQSLVQARIDRLDPMDKAAVQAASVLGQRFVNAALTHLLDNPDYQLEPLISRLFVRPEQARGDISLFTHVLVRDAVYDTLLRGRRRELHRRAAEWYADRDPVLRAEHLDRAEDAEAARAYLVAARSQAAEYRQEAALRLVERGLAVASEQNNRFALTCLQGDLLHDLGDMPAAGRAYRMAFEVAADDQKRCAAWLGLAAVKRVTDDLTGALADLERAEAVAVRCNLVAEQARIHFLRGNLCFPRGDLEGCLREHGIALELARRAGTPELEAMALGGLGDAEYVRGRMISAHDRFRQCVELCEQHGFGRIEVANRPMMAFAQWFAGDTRGALSVADAAITRAARVGHRRAEMIGHHAAFFCRHALMEFEAAHRHAEAALTLAQQLGARRFEPEALVFQAELHRLAGRRAEAFAKAEEAVKISRETSPAFLGPFALGALALASNDPSARHASLEEGEALLSEGAVSHNHLLFPREAIEVYLEAGDWERAERCATELERYTRSDPLPFAEFYIALGRALAACGRGQSDTLELVPELKRLCDVGQRLGILVALPGIKAAIGNVRGQLSFTTAGAPAS